MILSKLDKALKKKLGPEWHELELETLSLTLGAIFDDITIGKIMMLKAIENAPGVLLNDAEYMLRFIEIANENVMDPHYHDIPTCLELLFALSELEEILGKDLKVTHCLNKVTCYILDNEGHGEPYHPLLAKYSKRKLTNGDKSKAGDAYIKHMRGK